MKSTISQSRTKCNIVPRMNLSGEYTIPVPENNVWLAMNDPDLLKRCIRVCDRFERTSAETFQAHIRIRLGFIHTGFTVDIRVENAAPPHSYRLVAEGQGGIVGWARGWADVRLFPETGGTRLVYNADADLNGTLAKLASRLVEGVAQRYADEFFAEFASQATLKAAPETPG